MAGRVVAAQQGDTVDQICLRHYGRTGGVTEAVLDANPGLADAGVILPHGTTVRLPDLAPPASAPTVQLWD